MQRLFSDSLFEAELDTDKGLVRVTRSPLRVQSIEDGARSFNSLADSLESLEKASLRLLVDLRRGPMRNDPEFETAIASARKRLFAGFSRSAVLVRSAVGLLQVNRHAKQDQEKPFMCNNDEDALSFLFESAE